MNTKICDYHFTIKEAGKLLDDEFSYINLMQILFIYNDHMHVSYWDMLQKMDLLYYMIQTITKELYLIIFMVIRKYFYMLSWLKKGGASPTFFCTN